MARAKYFEFPTSVEWEGGSMTVASVVGRHDLDVATPPELGGEAEAVWSPEDLLVASASVAVGVAAGARAAPSYSVPHQALLAIAYTDNIDPRKVPRGTRPKQSYKNRRPRGTPRSPLACICFCTRWRIDQLQMAIRSRG